MHFETIALIDNDFLNHIVEIKKDNNKIIEIITSVFSEMKINPAIHPLVLKYEVSKNQKKIQNLIEKNIVMSPTLEDFFDNSDEKKKYYCFVAQELYKRLNGTQIREEDILIHWNFGQSLGEIHSLSACVICNCCVFLSDDHDSKSLKRIINDLFLFKINVYNRDDVVELLRNKGTSIGRDDLRSFSHSIIE